MAKQKMIQMRIPEELHSWFKAWVAEQGTTMTSVLVNHALSLRMHDDIRRGKHPLQKPDLCPEATVQECLEAGKW